MLPYKYIKATVTMNKTKTLRLPLKGKWFEMTKAGIKYEDYREINEYWIKRIVETDMGFPDTDNIMRQCTWND